MLTLAEWRNRSEETLTEGTKEWLAGLLLAISPALSQGDETDLEDAKLQLKRILVQQIDTMDVDDLRLKMQHASDFGTYLRDASKKPLGGKETWRDRIKAAGERARSQSLRSKSPNVDSIKSLLRR